MALPHTHRVATYEKGATANLKATPIKIRIYENRYRLDISFDNKYVEISLITKEFVIPYK